MRSRLRIFLRSPAKRGRIAPASCCRFIRPAWDISFLPNSVPRASEADLDPTQKVGPIPPALRGDRCKATQWCIAYLSASCRHRPIQQAICQMLASNAYGLEARVNWRGGRSLSCQRSAVVGSPVFVMLRRTQLMRRLTSSQDRNVPTSLEVDPGPGTRDRRN
jgi:hypothetical protein